MIALIWGTTSVSADDSIAVHQVLGARTNENVSKLTQATIVGVPTSAAVSRSPTRRGNAMASASSSTTTFSLRTARIAESG